MLYEITTESYSDHTVHATLEGPDNLDAVPIFERLKAEMKTGQRYHDALTQFTKCFIAELKALGYVEKQTTELHVGGYGRINEALYQYPEPEGQVDQRA